MTEVVIPGLNYAINASEEALYSFRFLRPLAGRRLESMLRGTVLPVKQPVFNCHYLFRWGHCLAGENIHLSPFHRVALQQLYSLRQRRDEIPADH